MLNLDEKIQGLKHIHYEAEMALLMAKALHVFWTRKMNGELGWISEPAIDLAVRGGLLEGLCTHTRNLILLLTRTDNRDINSSDYNYNSIELSSADNAFLDRLHQRVSHITKKRLISIKDWDFNNEFKAWFKKISDFFSYLLGNHQDLFTLLETDNKVGLKANDFKSLGNALASDNPLESDYKPRHRGRQTIMFT
ncbi:MAG: hypothetical protein KBA61_00135 [Spirochaetes bacterium]|nr:hypothetical protein [Spirochaetota bacterium]